MMETINEKISIARSFHFFGERIDVRIFIKNNLLGIFEIMGKNVSYAQGILQEWGGMQCQYMEGTPEYENVNNQCKRIRDLFLKANKIAILDDFIKENSRTMLHY